ncbi:MAG: hypothetical protein ACTS7E_00860 [Arsenophonus sp. NC-CH8-MAG3]
MYCFHSPKASKPKVKVELRMEARPWLTEIYDTNNKDLDALLARLLAKYHLQK